MLAPLLNPTLLLLQHGQTRATFALAEGITSIGRAPANAIVLDDNSVSRHHAEIEVAAGTVKLRDAGSRNGVQVNGVPRREAVLQPGDSVRIGAVELKFAAGFIKAVPPPPRAALPAKPAKSLTETHRRRAPLPESRQDRHLATLYQLCFSVAEGIEPAEAEKRFLELLLESTQAQLAQYYTAEGPLSQSVSLEKISAPPKFAPYLLEKFQQLTEPTPYTAQDLARFQVRLDRWQFIVAPVRAPGAPAGDPAPLLVLARPAEWQEFSAEDRVLINAAIHLWVRGEQQGRKVAALRRENIKLRDRVGAASGLLGDSPALHALRTRLDRVAATKATVLITGETGSGKEVVAQHLHDQSPRAKAAFVKVNCAAIPHSLIESELFGHAKGAFTDAKTDHAGKFQQADGGTLFLDEVGELPLPVQAKLLRALESGEVERIGSARPTRVDVRILAATNRDLRTEVRNGTFREDLLYRLEVAKITVPPLRDHPEDIPHLARHFLAAFCTENGLAALDFAPEALPVLQRHPWPGNVRELRNVVQRVALETSQPKISAADIRSVLS